MQRSHTLPFVLTLGAACGSPSEKPIIATPVGAKTTQIVGQAPLPIIDASIAGAPTPPKLTCDDGSTIVAAAYPESTWFCARADGTRHGRFITLYPDQRVEIEGSYTDGKLDGAWRRLHPSGALAEAGTYVAGQRDGVWRQLGPSGNVLGEYTLKLGTGTQKRWLDDGALYSEVTLNNGVPHGPMRMYEANGRLAVSAKLYMGKLDGRHVVGARKTLRIEETFVRGKLRGSRKVWRFFALLIDEAYDTKGRLDGSFTMWRDRRTPRVQGTYDHGKRTGTWTWTDKNNKKEREGNYVDGKKHGVWTEWIDNKLSFQGRYTDGKPEGEHVYYDKRGSELGRFAITGGTGTIITFHANGNPSSKTQLKNGVMDGKHQEFTPRGKLIVEGRYLADRKHGVWREQTETGVPVLEQRYKRGKLDGHWKKFIDGKLAVEAMYKDGLAEGTYTEYRNGKPALVGQFAADKRTGTWTAYDTDGSVTLSATYKNGVLDGPWRQLVSGVVLDGHMGDGRRIGTWTQTDRAGQQRAVTYGTP